MHKPESEDIKAKKKLKFPILWIFLIVFFVLFILISLFPKTLGLGTYYQKDKSAIVNELVSEILKKEPVKPVLDKELYDKKMLELANNPIPKIVYETKEIITKDEKGNNVKTVQKIPLDPQPVVQNIWPIKTPYPLAGAILPFKRVIAYYGNLYSTKMGVLGEYPEEKMLSRLMAEAKKWEEADPHTPVLPALHYIAVTAQLNKGEDGKHRLRMPSKEIDKVLKMAEKINAIVFLDFQVGFSTLEEELPVFKKYFELPNVHLGIDPEFSMKGDIRPGKVVGTFDAKDVNFAIDFLAKIVKEKELTPKILVVHRYTKKMLTNYQNIKPVPEVQVVMHMDGWGGKAKKINTYKSFIFPEPVQFTGFKIFYKNDIWDAGTTLFTPSELLKLQPRPIYIQYQ